MREMAVYLYMLSKRAGGTRRAIAQYESGEMKNPSVPNVQKLADEYCLMATS